MVVRGAALYYVGGAPKGYLTDNFRMFGRNYIQDVPFFTRIPYSFIILIILATIAYYHLPPHELWPADPRGWG